MASKRIGVVLSGCGVYDGTEIHEATLTLYFLDRAAADIIAMAPNIPQHHVINHLTGAVTNESRNVLVESARITRGQIRDIAQVTADQLDAIILPGGFGAAKNLSTVAFDGPSATVNPEVSRLLQEMAKAGKPIGALCIAPALLSKVLAGKGVTLTIGDDAGVAGAIEKMGNKHQLSAFDGIVVDAANRIVTTAAYMCASSIGEAGQGIEKLVAKIMEMA
ncbi:MAG: isoprenoid biosynthesis glyoxalase ElbB [Magnetococcales bacterium]|nr:isoprenoid biosynthesis glyoxalase ElbB [Magnetococcales bacterium]MBF0149261.1 isoprenoid biosynthesis glyoxalase ElbB [Magnetococcales bacterium]MBF0172794.1 isoprenoid biosynthesis glyoxalase ElbB [Magnetococcales bacterium]MBF0348004.1 isoprenoid biosynthesis glyoxalase ElbB [Magnetococcales bacterium]MBF0632169.1 isoprenoid biosynthesis glyoxalase ElbB [Magnetococcales bacterium]